MGQYGVSRVFVAGEAFRPNEADLHCFPGCLEEKRSEIRIEFQAFFKFLPCGFRINTGFVKFKSIIPFPE